jgi:plastocyanin
MSSKKNTSLPRYLIFIFIFVVLLVIVLTTFLSIRALSNHKSANEPITVTCNEVNKKHFVYISKNQFSPKEINAELCDSITFVNQDKYRMIAFGQHTKHIEYDGVYEKPLEYGESFTITLNKSGEYVYHDHLQEYIGGSFTVAEPN